MPSQSPWNQCLQCKLFSFIRYGVVMVLNSLSLILIDFRLSEFLRAGCLAANFLKLIPSERISAKDALAHNYFSSLPKAIFSISDSKLNTIRCVCVCVREGSDISIQLTQYQGS